MKYGGIDENVSLQNIEHIKTLLISYSKRIYGVLKISRIKENEVVYLYYALDFLVVFVEYCKNKM